MRVSAVLRVGHLRKGKELERMRQVLSHQLREMQQQAEPREQQLAEMQEQIRELDQVRWMFFLGLIITVTLMATFCLQSRSLLSQKRFGLILQFLKKLVHMGNMRLNVLTSSDDFRMA